MKIRVEEEYKGKIFGESTYCDLDEKVIQKLNKREQLFDAVNHVYYDLEHYNFEKRFLKLICEYEGETMTLNLYIDFVNGFVYFIDENENVISNSTLENNEYREFIHSYISYFEQIVDYNLSESKEDCKTESIEDWRTFYDRSHKSPLKFYSRSLGLCFWYCFTGRSEEECYKAICGRNKKEKQYSKGFESLIK